MLNSNSKSINITPVFCVVSSFVLLLILRDFLKFSIPLELFVLTLALGVFFFKKSDYAILGVVTIPLGHGVQVPSLLLVCLVAIFFKYIVPNKIRVTKITLCIFGLCLIELCNVIIHPYSEFVEFIRYAVSLMFLAFILDNTDENDKEFGSRIFNYYITIYTFVMFDIVYQLIERYGSIVYIISNGIRFGNLAEKGEHLVSLYDNENNIALFSLIAVMACIAELWKYGNNERKPFLYILLLISSFFGFMTLSKAYLFSYVFLGTLILIKILLQTNTSIVRKLGIFCSTILLAVFAYIEIFADVINNIFNRIDTTEISTGRIDIFNMYNDYILNNLESLFFGIGIQNPAEKTGIWNSMHNGIQQVYVSFGIVGLILFTILIYNIVKKANIHRKCKISLINIIVFLALFVYTQSIQFMSSSSIFLFLIIVYYYLAYSYEETKMYKNKFNLLKCKKQIDEY